MEDESARFSPPSLLGLEVNSWNFCAAWDRGRNHRMYGDPVVPDKDLNW